MLQKMRAIVAAHSDPAHRVLLIDAFCDFLTDCGECFDASIFYNICIREGLITGTEIASNKRVMRCLEEK